MDPTAPRFSPQHPLNLPIPNFGLPPAVPKDHINPKTPPLPSPKLDSKSHELKSILKKACTTISISKRMQDLTSKHLRFEKTVKHRTTIGRQEANCYSQSELDQTIPLIDESQNLNTSCKDKMSISDAIYCWEMEAMRISVWKNLEPAFRPRGKNPLGSRKDRTQNEKALTKREESKIKVYTSPSWKSNIRDLEEKAIAKLNSEGLSITKARLLRVMYFESEIIEELTLDDLKYLYCSIFFINLYNAKEVPDMFLDVVKQLQISEDTLIYELLYNLAIDSITKNKEGKFDLKYKPIPEFEILLHLLDTTFPES